MNRFNWLICITDEIGGQEGADFFAVENGKAVSVKLIHLTKFNKDLALG